MSKLYNTLLISGLALLSSCSQHGDVAVNRVMVSIPPQKTLVEAVGGDRVDVGCVMTSDANPESFEPSMNTLVDIQRSDIYFMMGTLDFERNLESVGENGDIDVVNMSDSVTLIYGTHGDACHHDADAGHHHHHHDADPHVWSSLRNMRVMAANVARALCEKDPDGCEYYNSNLKKLYHEIDSLDNVVKSRLDSLDTRAFVVWHPSLSYFANDYGLKQITVGTHGKELSVGEMAQRIKSALADSVGVFFFQQEFDSRQAAEINRQLGAEMVTVNPMNADWKSEILKITDALRHKK